MRVTAHQGDTIDLLCYRHLGRTDNVEAVLELNPCLAALGTILPRGTPVELPDAILGTETTRTPTIQLWD